MKLSEIQNSVEEYGKVVSARIPTEYFKFLKKNKISIKKMVLRTIEELMEEEKRGNKK